MEQGEEAGLRRWVSVAQASELTSLGKSTIYELLDRGELAYTRVRGRRCIPYEALVAMMDAGLVRERKGG